MSVTKLFMFIFAVFVVKLSHVVLFLSQQTVDLALSSSSILFPPPPPRHSSYPYPLR